MARTRPKKRVLILGGGYVGLYVAWGLERHAELPIEVTLVEPRTYMTYQPLLPEVAGGHVEPRNVTVDLRQALTSTEVLRGSATGLDIDAHTATVGLIDGTTRTLQWDQVVLAMGAITRVFKTPGLAEQGIGFKTLDEAVYTRNKLLQNIAKAAATDDEAERRKYLTGVFIGGGYTGVEALAELSDLSKKAIKAYPQLAGEEPRWIVIEALDRIAPEVGPELSRWSLGEFEQRGVDVRLRTTMKSCENGDVVLSTGETIPAGLIVWTAGVKPNPVLDSMNVPRGPKGHVNANAKLQVIREDGTPVPGVWSAGDIAQVPDLTKEQPAYYPPNAQNAVRQATLLAESIAKAVRGRRPRNYVHYSLGTVASYGILRGAANIKGLQLTEMWAWLAHRSYHLLAMPTFDRKWRILTNWAGDAIGRIDLTPTPSSQDSRDPQAEFAEAARTA